MPYLCVINAFFFFCLFCFVLFCFVLFCFVLFCFVLFCFVLFVFCLFFCCWPVGESKDEKHSGWRGVDLGQK